MFPQFSPKEKDAGIFRYVKALQQKLIFEVEITQTGMVLPIGLVVTTGTSVILEKSFEPKKIVAKEVNVK